MQSRDKEEFNPNWVSPPGDTIRDTLDVIGMTRKQFAEQMQMDLMDVYELEHGRLQIDFRIAQRLAHVLDIDAQFWINREKHYRDKLKELNK